MLDIIITSSCRKSIIKTLDSFFARVHCSKSIRLLIHIDVLHPDQLNLIKDYLRNLKLEKKIEILTHVNPHPARNWYAAHSNAILHLYGLISTACYFHLEDDWRFLKNIDLDPLIRLMEKYPDIDNIRFSRERIKKKVWLYHLSDEITEEFLAPNIECLIDNISLIQTPIWSFNPHLGRTSIIKNITDIPKNQNPEKFVCLKYIENGKHNGTYVYGKIGDSAYVNDLGRNKIRRKIQKYKYILTGGKYAEYRFDLD